MGTCCVDANTKYIESKMRENEQLEKVQNKLLFLGPGGSGKSTIFKQLQWLHGGGFSEEDARSLKEQIHNQIISQMQQAIKHYLNNDETETKVADDELQNAIDTIKKCNDMTTLPGDVATCIKYIWQNDVRLDGIFKVQEKSAAKVLDETTEYFWNSMDRITDEDYIPNKQDIINVRYRTTGIVQKRFEINNAKFHIFDVGGQKSERKKWMTCFDNVKAVVFVVSLACYNELMFEDENRNCMVDSIELFDKTVNISQFSRTPIILFLNKMDLFEVKIKTLPITVCPSFTDFNEFKNEDVVTNDPNNYDQTTFYIKEKFKAINQQTQALFVHVTCAFNDNNIAHVFNAVTQIVLSINLKKVGITDPNL